MSNTIHDDKYFTKKLATHFYHKSVRQYNNYVIVLVLFFGNCREIPIHICIVIRNISASLRITPLTKFKIRIYGSMTLYYLQS